MIVAQLPITELPSITVYFFSIFHGELSRLSFLSKNTSHKPSRFYLFASMFGFIKSNQFLQLFFPLNAKGDKVVRIRDSFATNLFFFCSILSVNILNSLILVLVQ